MTTAQIQFCQEKRNTKPHRVCWFMPSWIRDGFNSRADESRALYSRTELEYFASEQGHPLGDMARDALGLK